MEEPDNALDQLSLLLLLPYNLSPAWLLTDPTFAPLSGNPWFARSDHLKSRSLTLIDEQEVESAEQLELVPDHAALNQEKLDKKRTSILASIGGGNLGTMELKAAWILNNYPETRDSDLKLQLAYWREFEGYNGGAIYPEDLFRLTRLTSLARAGGVTDHLGGADERPGTYSVSLEADGWQPWDTAGIVVRSDGCHVQTASFTAELRPTP